MKEKVYVFGHRNPDTDAVTAAIALAYMKKQLGMNANKLIFNSNYRTILNYIHKKEEYKKYDSYEAEWLSKRIVRRLETKDIKDIIEADEIEELKLI